ncbi:hypothetical protein COCCADRAFT_9127 [Bipolaris zeicola 26-R-13]|uniref:Rhodopsin domain-containing protein n=1 Tax=Cochliobolus carbonum (strain 26-R-13) TaxID=930089 RepID=W6XT35_COCC2|nr:uncharacterized protein COCCADRAFT_9127 [Bipolaris zeicola 26-R-13]EUC28505.1 hypothetical protein COCCADRAFT_9127 [Bipolaris zeicola 26-R-13]
MAPNVGLGSQGPVERGWGLWLTSVLAVVLAGFFVGARIVQRFIKKSGLGIDDYLIIAALFSSILLTVTECQAVVYGYGRPWKTLPSESRMTARKWFYGANIVYKVVLLFNKMSVVCLYYRIFAIITTSFRIACHVMNVWIVTTGIAFTLATIFQCTPIAAFWDHSIEGAKCFHNQPWWISYATVQIITDFVLLAMPFRQILKLSMGTTEKLGVALVFGTGGFVTFASIYRATTIAISASNPDPTWGPIPATIWSVIEANAGIICACLPMLRAPFVRLLGPLFGSHRASKANTKRLSYPMIWQSNHHPGTGHRSTVSHPRNESQRDSESNIIDDDILPPSRPGALNRQNSDIVVTNEFSIERNKLQKSKTETTICDTNTARSVSEDKPEGKSPYYHV